MKDILNEELVAIERTLNDYFATKKEAMKPIGPMHVDFYENIREYMTRGGKRLRPVLIAIGYKVIRDNVNFENLYRAALSLEFLHNGSLLHDDLIDHDETRRGGPTYHVIYSEWFEKNVKPDKAKADDFGMALAILGGDALINMGSQMFTSVGLPPEVGMKCLEYYQFGFQNLVEGVLLELTMVRDPNVTPEMYLKMIYMKTAVLFERALMMGAVMANATESQLQALGEFGTKSGQAFQIQDDILGSFGDEEVTGKPSDGDIREAKRTMLVLQSYKLANEEQKKILDDYLGKDDITPEEIEKVREIFRKCGALKATQELMDNLLEASHKALDKAEPPLISKYKEFLVQISNFLAKRDY